MAVEAPKYRLNHTSYIDDRMYLAGADGPIDKETGEERPVYYTDHERKHTPGPHWEPVNDAAKARMKECGIVYTGLVPDSMDELVEQLELAKARAKERDQNGMAAGIVAALIDAGVVQVPKKKAPSAPSEPAEI